jgi:hypothetical protein
VRGIGGWTGSNGLIVSGLQWQRCDALGTNCIYITNRGTYTIQSADSGSVIRLVFSVQNSLGSVPVAVLTQPVGGTPPPPPGPPSNLGLPTISGTAQEAQTLAASPGSWSGSPTSYAYQWARCDEAGANCAAISSGTSSSYVAQTADVGSTLAVIVTASNASGSTAAASSPTAVIASAPPPAPPPTSPAPTTQTMTFSGSLNPKNPTRSFGISVGAGTATAQLSFSKCSALSLVLADSKGSAVANASGPSIVTLASNVAAGTYNYVVSGGRCSFTLAVTSAAP